MRQRQRGQSVSGVGRGVSSLTLAVSRVSVSRASRRSLPGRPGLAVTGSSTETHLHRPTLSLLCSLYPSSFLSRFIPLQAQVDPES
jgi:hypothetical protein